jgi:hypothetical protein
MNLLSLGAPIALLQAIQVVSLQLGTGEAVLHDAAAVIAPLDFTLVVQA